MAEIVVERAEYESRINRVREALVRDGFDGILVVDPANLYYLTGYNAWSFYMPQALYVPVGGDVTLMMREMDAVGAHRTAVVGASWVLGYPETYVHQQDRHPMTWCAEQLVATHRILPGTRRIAYEGDAHFFSPRSFRAFADAVTAAIPGIELVDSHELVNWVRVVKSDTEIDIMRRAGVIASEAMRVGIEAIDEGVSQAELAALILAQQARGVPGSEGDYPAIMPMLPIGEGADTPHLTWTGKPLVRNEGVSIELAGVYRRYHAPLARTVALGTPSAELDRVAKVTVEGLQAALDAVRPGATAADPVLAWERVIAQHGLEKRSRLGYSVGVGYPPDWGEHTVSLRADDTTELQENMTFHMIAGMWMIGYGYELSETIRVSADGVEVLTDAPRRLIVRGA